MAWAAMRTEAWPATWRCKTCSESCAAVKSPRRLPKRLQRALEVVNLEVYKAAQQLGGGKMGTTLTAAYVFGNLLYLLHVGDSRAYLVRDGQAACLTSDHTMVGDLVRSRLIPSENIRTHAQRSILTRAVGLGLFVQPEIAQTKLQAETALFYAATVSGRSSRMTSLPNKLDRAGDVHSLRQNLVDLALERETDDNCSVVAIHIRGFRYQTFEEEPRKERGWLGFFRK